MIGRTGRGIPCVVFGVLAGACAAEAALALPSETQVVAAFEARVKEYVDLHRKLEAKLPKLPKQSTPVQVDKHQLALGNRIKSARRDAAPGEFFTREMRSEEHTSELQSRFDLVCRLLLEKKSIGRFFGTRAAGDQGCV